MRNTQDKVLAMLAAIASKHDLELVVDKYAANVGTALFQDPEHLDTYVEVHFNFQPANSITLSATDRPGTPTTSGVHAAGHRIAFCCADPTLGEAMQGVLDAVDHALGDL